LLSYNIRSLRDDADAVARVIRSAAPHVVCIQEAPRFFRWRSKCAALARRSGLVIVTGGRPAAANMIFSTLAVNAITTRDVLFSHDDRRTHQRGVALAVLSLGGAPFAVAGTHLDNVDALPARHVDELHAALDAFAPADAPQFVVGDTNNDPGSIGWQAFERRGTDAWAAVGAGEGLTSNATHPSRRIDAVFADPRVRVVSAEVLDSSDVLIASDHRPLLVELEI
jgi:endonuclease/exonuclease/phosphatase family metal-dependent hydrolase